MLPPRALGLLALSMPQHHPSLTGMGTLQKAGTVPSRAKISLAPAPSTTLAHGGSWEQQLHPCVAPKVEEGTM